MTKQKQTEHKRNKWLRFSIISLTLILAIGCVFCSDIFSIGESITKDLFTKIKDFYCNGLFYLLGGLDLLLMALYAKDEKKFAIFKTAGIWVIVIFIVFHMADAIRGTASNIASKFDSAAGGTSVEYTGDTSGTSDE